MLWTEKQLENLSLKEIFWFCWFLQEKGVLDDKLLGGGVVTTNQTDIVPPPLLTSPENQPHWTHTSFVHKNGFFFFFSLGLGLGPRVRIKMWMMWNNTRPPLH